MGTLWEVIGGGDKGGVLVREGEGLKSATCADRLSTGATVEELGKDKSGDRLHYKLVEGTGPKEGWVAIRLKDKELLIEKGEENYTIAEDGILTRKLPDWKGVPHQHFEFMEMKDRAAMKTPGDYFGIDFPCTEEEMTSMGTKWLTKAFKKTGVMAKDNSVTEMKLTNVTGTVSGGAGLKYTLKVKYAKEEPYLHTDLFVKLPHNPAKGSDRYYVSVMWGHDRPESIFNIYLAPFVPFKVPKMYFADISATSTNFCLITEAVKFAPKGTTEFKPGDIEPSFLKYADFEMIDGGPMYYMASCKALGIMAAYHKTGRLHPQINEMFPMPGDCWEVPKGMPGMDEMSKKGDMAKVDQFIRFMSDTAKHVYPKSITDKSWLEQWKKEVEVINDFGTEIHCFCSGAGTSSPNDYVCFTHNNLQVDNAIYYHNDANELCVGMLDWGAMSCGPFINAITGGCISGAQVDILVEHREKFIKAAVDAYAENGGPQLDTERMMIMFDLQVANWVGGLGKNTSAVLKDVKAKTWPEVKDLNDPKIRASWNAWAWCSQFNNALLLYQKLNIWDSFQKWLASQGLPPKK